MQSARLTPRWVAFSKVSDTGSRYLIPILILSLILPSPAFGLRTEPPTESGLEEDIRAMLTGSGKNRLSPDERREPGWSTYAGQIKHVLYPASGGDSDTIRRYLDRLPLVTDIYLEDINYAMPSKTGWHLFSHDTSFFHVRGDAIYRVMQFLPKDGSLWRWSQPEYEHFRQVGMLDVQTEYRGRAITVHLRRANFFAYSPPGDAGRVDLTIVHRPGYAGQLTRQRLFWDSVLARTKPGGFVSVSEASVPDEMSRILTPLFIPSSVLTRDARERKLGHVAVFGDSVALYSTPGALAVPVPRGGLEEVLDARELAAIAAQIKEHAKHPPVEGPPIQIPPGVRIVLHVAKNMTSTVTFKVFNDVFRQLEEEKLIRPHVMVPFPIPDGDEKKYEQLIRAVKQGLTLPNGSQVVMLNVGAPFKMAGTKWLDEKDPKTQGGTTLILRREDGQLWGTLNDGEAWVNWFKRAYGSLSGRRVVILGTNVGSAIAWAMKDEGIQRLVVTNLGNPQAAQRLARDLRLDGINSQWVRQADDPERGSASSKLHQEIKRANVVINATGRGRRPDLVASPLVNTTTAPLKYRSDAIVVDLNLHLESENFLTQAAAITPGIRQADGVGMMVELNAMQMADLFGWGADDLRMERLRTLVRDAAVRYGAAPRGGPSVPRHGSGRTELGAGLEEQKEPVEGEGLKVKGEEREGLSGRGARGDGFVGRGRLVSPLPPGVSRTLHKRTRFQVPSSAPLRFQPPNSDYGPKIQRQSNQKDLGLERPAYERPDHQPSKDDRRGVGDESHQVLAPLGSQSGLQRHPKNKLTTGGVLQQERLAPPPSGIASAAPRGGLEEAPETPRIAVRPYGRSVDEIYGIMRGLHQEDVASKGWVSAALTRAQETARREGRRASALVIGVGAGRIVWDLEQAFPGVDLTCLNKERIELDADLEAAAKVFSDYLSSAATKGESRAISIDDAKAFLARFRDPMRGAVIHDANASLPFNDGAFDVVLVASSVIEYIERKAELLMEAKRVTRWSGEIIVNAFRGFQLYDMHPKEFFQQYDPDGEYEYVEELIPDGLMLGYPILDYRLRIVNKNPGSRLPLTFGHSTHTGLSGEYWYASYYSRSAGPGTDGIVLSTTPRGGLEEGKGSWVRWIPFLGTRGQIPWKVYPTIYEPYNPEGETGSQHIVIALAGWQRSHPNLIWGRRVLDMGVGSGPLAAYVLQEGASEVVGIDVNPNAIPNTEENLSAHFPGLAPRFRGYVGDLFKALPVDKQEPFDLILFNTPVFDQEPQTLEDWGVDAGPDHKTIQEFLRGLESWLAPHGVAFIRIHRVGGHGYFGMSQLEEMIQEEKLPLQVGPPIERGSMFVVAPLTLSGKNKPSPTLPRGGLGERDVAQIVAVAEATVKASEAKWGSHSARVAVLDASALEDPQFSAVVAQFDEFGERMRIWGTTPKVEAMQTRNKRIQTVQTPQEIQDWVKDLYKSRFVLTVVFFGPPEREGPLREAVKELRDSEGLNVVFTSREHTLLALFTSLSVPIDLAEDLPKEIAAGLEQQQLLRTGA